MNADAKPAEREILFHPRAGNPHCLAPIGELGFKKRGRTFARIAECTQPQFRQALSYLGRSDNPNGFGA